VGAGAIVTARFGADRITVRAPKRASKGARRVFEKVCERVIQGDVHVNLRHPF
jgi:PleD family two-component response regulator